jgi:para-nitrobenzyl esterase
MGESTGGASIGVLLISPGAKGLFSKAVAMSPWGLLQSVGHLRTSSYGRKPAEQMGEELGKLSDLRSKTAAEVMMLTRAAGGGVTNHLVVDGVVIPDDPALLLQRGEIAPVKLIVGSNRDEGTIFPAATNLTEARARAVANVGPGAEKLIEIYGATDAQAQDANLSVTRDALSSISARELARVVSGKSSAWQYEFSRVSGAGERTQLGAYHGAEIPYFFRNLPATAYAAPRIGVFKPNDFGAIDETLSLGMSDYLLNFLKTSDPNGPGLAPWPKFTTHESAGDEKYMEFGDGFTVKSDLRKIQLDPIQQFYLGQLAKRGG